jgi:hypothetical protein
MISHLENDSAIKLEDDLSVSDDQNISIFNKPR